MARSAAATAATSTPMSSSVRAATPPPSSQQGDQDVRRLDGAAVELGGEAGGELEDLGAARREDHLAALLLGTGPDAPADGLGGLVDVDRLGGERAPHLGVAERDDAEEEVLGADVVVPQLRGDARRARQQQLARLAQVVDHECPPSVRATD